MRKANKQLAPLQEIDTNKGKNLGLSSILGCNAFNGMLKFGKMTEDEVDLKADKAIKNNIEFLSHRLENVDINFLKRNSPFTTR